MDEVSHLLGSVVLSNSFSRRDAIRTLRLMGSNCKIVVYEKLRCVFFVCGKRVEVCRYDSKCIAVEILIFVFEVGVFVAKLTCLFCLPVRTFFRSFESLAR